MRTYEQIVEHLQKEKEKENIICPYCNHTHSDSEDLQGHVSYWGEDGEKEYCCYSCDSEFYVKECVTRIFECRKKDE
jgi:transposase-like protein